jgi:hypothetical protein
VLLRVTALVFTLQEKVPPAGEVVVAQLPLVVLPGAVGPSAKSVGVQLTITEGGTVQSTGEVKTTDWQPPSHVGGIGQTPPGMASKLAVIVIAPGATPKTKPGLALPADCTVATDVLLLDQSARLVTFPFPVKSKGLWPQGYSFTKMVLSVGPASHSS